MWSRSKWKDEQDKTDAGEQRDPEGKKQNDLLRLIEVWVNVDGVGGKLRS